MSHEFAGEIDYNAHNQHCQNYEESSEHKLVEALATGIARICVVQHGAERVIVNVQKPGALRFAESVGVEIERERADFE